ncbi:MAG: NAD-dependent epimerase/dehydratase family protein [Patescibacteria group bacterium]|jgi:nucleoside-diphosphate-sugar epimerase
MKVLVTGAAGFIGSHLAEKLADLGHEVIGVDSLVDYYSVDLKKINIKNIIAKGVKFYEIDLLDDELGEVIKGVEIVYHAAAQPGISDQIPLGAYSRNNILATDKLLKAAANLPALKLFIYFSTSSVYGKIATLTEQAVPDPQSYYAITKLAGEQLALLYYKSSGLPACSVRLFSTYGPRERPEKLIIRLIMSVFTGQAVPIYEGSLDHSRSYTYISDIIDGLILFLDKADICRGGIFNLGSDQEAKTAEVIEIIEKIAGKNANKIILPARGGDQLRTKANIEKIKNLLSYQPRVSLRQGLEKTFAWYKEYYKK